MNEERRVLPRSGKLPPDILEGVFFGKLGATDDRVVLGPARGEDAAVIEMSEGFLVVSCDPITATTEEAGWLCVNVTMNDVAVSGVEPRWFMPAIMMPPASSQADLEEMSESIDSASERIGVSVVGGHTEITPQLDTPLVVGTGLGIGDSYVTSGGSQPGDLIVVTKSVALEGSAILAREMNVELRDRLGSATVDELAGYLYEISVVKEAMLLPEAVEVTSMHDPTEGGLATGLHEMADASGNGFFVREEDVPVYEPIRKLSETVRFDPLAILSSGCVTATVTEDSWHELGRNTKREMEASVVGRVREDDRRLIETREGGIVDLPRPERDEVWRVLASSRAEDSE